MNMKQAIEQYNRSGRDVFSASDIQEIHALAAGDAFDMIGLALDAGYMIGRAQARTGGNTMGEVISVKEWKKPRRTGKKAEEAAPRGGYGVIIIARPDLEEKVDASWDGTRYTIFIYTNDDYRIPELLKRGRAMLPPEIRDRAAK